MTAVNAKEAALKARQPNMQAIYDVIRDAANQGEMHVNIEINKQMAWSIKLAIEELEKSGYRIADKENREKTQNQLESPMKASEAKEITNSARNVDLTPIFGKIKAYAMAGDSSVAFPLDGVFLKNVEDIMNRLRKEGYTVKRQQGYDCRDQSAWDNLLIVW